MSALATANATARLDPRLVELMTEAAYEASRPAGSSRPPWRETHREWQEAARREMAAAIVAAERAGFRISQS